MIVDSNGETNLLRSLLTDRQILRLCEAFRKNSSVEMKLSKTELSNMVQLGGL